MEITSVEEQKKDKNRVSVFINGGFSFGLTKEDALLYNIKAGRILSEEEYKDIVQNVLFEDAKNKALKFLSYSSRTMGEVASKLKEYDFSKEVIKEVIIYLRKRNFINDKSYAEDYMADRLKRGYGKSRIVKELMGKGIKPEYIALASELSQTDPVEVIHNLLKKRIKSSTKKAFYENERRKIYNYLAGRGFKYEDAKKALDLYWKSAAQPDSEDENDCEEYS